MKIKLLLCALALPTTGVAQQRDPLLDKLSGKWVLEGTIGKQHTIHDVEAHWLFGNEYLRFHETSREKKADGTAQYEAVVYLGADAAKNQYGNLWLDNTAAWDFSANGIGHGKREGDAIRYRFMQHDATAIETTFAYDKTKDVWAWSIDNVDHAKRSQFARVTLTRAPGDVEIIRQLEERRRIASLNGDTVALAQLFAPGFYEVGINGGFRTRAQNLSERGRGALKFDKVEFDSVDVKIVNSTTAVVTGIVRRSGTNNGQPFDQPAVRYSRIYSMSDGVWQIVFGQNTTIAK